MRTTCVPDCPAFIIVVKHTTRTTYRSIKETKYPRSSLFEMKIRFSKRAHGGVMEAKEGKEEVQIVEDAIANEGLQQDVDEVPVGPKRKKTVKHSPRKLLTTTDGIIRRYKNALKRFTKFGSMKKAFTKINVDRNTIARTAIIAELAITYPDTFQELLPTDEVNEKISEFAERCKRAMTKEMAETITAKKKTPPNNVQVHLFFFLLLNNGRDTDRIDGSASSTGSDSEPSRKTRDGPLMLIYDVQKQNTSREVGQMAHGSESELAILQSQLF
ncbi:coiled-coil domain-containing protein 106-like [Carassius carassius]|uniref:coiled-coil domain-containing protein 106-like n=1 Tax=Carassius carassius TaxID=217509 RepID=UPI002868893D|nr:coiled-coil domain-containing protein 106-like [Carassius carassius]